MGEHERKLLEHTDLSNIQDIEKNNARNAEYNDDSKEDTRLPKISSSTKEMLGLSPCYPIIGQLRDGTEGPK
jgi:hypothetical protein